MKNNIPHYVTDWVKNNTTQLFEDHLLSHYSFSFDEIQIHFQGDVIHHGISCKKYVISHPKYRFFLVLMTRDTGEFVNFYQQDYFRIGIACYSNEYTAEQLTEMTGISPNGKYHSLGDYKGNSTTHTFDFTYFPLRLDIDFLDEKEQLNMWLAIFDEKKSAYQKLFSLTRAHMSVMLSVPLHGTGNLNGVSLSKEQMSKLIEYNLSFSISNYFEDTADGHFLG